MRFIGWLKKNNRSGNGSYLYATTNVFVYTVALVVIVAIIIELLASVSLGLSISNATQYLEQRGYWVLAEGDCYSEDFVPCTGTQSLGTEGNPWEESWVGSGSSHIGTVTISNSEQQLDINGQLVMHGAGKVWMEVQPNLDYATIANKGAPTIVYYGTNSGFSLPRYRLFYELFASLDVPREWDGVTNPLVHIHLYIPQSDNLDKRFRLKLDWNAFTPHDNDVLSNIPITTTQEVLCVSNTAYTSYVTQFELMGDMTVCDQLDLRLRRIDASENEIIGEVVITHIGIQFLRDKLGTITPNN